MCIMHNNWRRLDSYPRDFLDAFHFSLNYICFCRYHAWFDDSSSFPGDETSNSLLPTQQVFRYYLGAYASVQEAVDARAIAEAALTEHQDLVAESAAESANAATASISSSYFESKGRRCQCVVELPSDRALILVLPCTHGQSSSSIAGSSSYPSASNVRSHLGATSDSSNFPTEVKLAGKRPRNGSSSEGKPNTKRSRNSSAPTTASEAVLHELTNESGTTVGASASSTSSWSSEAAARCQRALMAYAMGHKLPGISSPSYVTGDWVMARWANSLWFFAKVSS